MRLVDIKDVKNAFMGKCDLDEESIQTIIDEIPTTEKGGMKSIEEGLPIVGLNVLCQWEKSDLIHNSKDIYQTIMHRNADNEWISDFGVCTGKVTHWMHLPFVV